MFKFQYELEELPKNFEIYTEVDDKGSCLFDSWAFHLAHDGIKLNPQEIRKLANDFIFEHFNNKPLPVRERGLDQTMIELVDDLVSEAYPRINLTEKAEYEKMKWIKEVGKTFRFTRKGFREHYNKPEVYGDAWHHIALSFRFKCPVVIYMFNDNSYTVTEYNFTHFPSGITKYFHLTGHHFQPLIDTSLSNDFEGDRKELRQTVSKLFYMRAEQFENKSDFISQFRIKIEKLETLGHGLEEVITKEIFIAALGSELPQLQSFYDNLNYEELVKKAESLTRTESAAANRKSKSKSPKRSQTRTEAKQVEILPQEPRATRKKSKKRNE